MNVRKEWQEIFDTVAPHLLTQPRSLLRGFFGDIKGPCLHARTGERCPIGLFIDDETYFPAMERMPLLDVISYVPRLIDCYNKDQRTFYLLDDLRCIHDYGGIINDLCPSIEPLKIEYLNYKRTVKELLYVVRKYELNTEVLNNIHQRNERHDESQRSSFGARLTNVLWRSKRRKDMGRTTRKDEKALD